MRARVVATTTDAERQRETNTSDRLAARAVTSAAAVEKNRINVAARKIARKVHHDPDEWTVRTMRAAMRNYREVFDDALDHAIGHGWIVEHTEPGPVHGQDRHALHPGTEAPT